ncbi:hypothetical protein RN001_015686 [Aquatica leii]|uniref:Uncharacterized protein n=1 Tax=Aquatica leii TaxID=1421715 RepID=A0AAN7SAS7_9COLE|nr:hypothetical protein RN001_015686 [Aquatica leii]
MNVDEFHSTNSSTRLVEVEKPNSESCGFHLTRSKWDPYPWVSKVDEGTPAETAGMQPGECVLEINGEDIVGKRISEIAERVRSGSNQISLLLWNSGVDMRCSPESLCCGSMPQNLQRLTTCMSSILSVLECPVCLDTIAPPVHQCENGHLICLRCRTKTERCPVCRIRLSRGRSLLAEQVYNTISDVFGLHDDTQQIQKTKMQSIFKLNAKKKNIPDIKITQSHTNKFLARIIGKSTSVDNLSNECDKSPLTTRRVLEDDFGNTLKAKSLSTSEIFKTSPCNSRTSSFNNIDSNKYAGKRFLNLDNGVESGPASYHGSIESMEQSLNVEVATLNNVGVLYPCPYLDTCMTTIRESQVFTHFQETHSGPLVQYFQPKVQLSFSILRANQDLCYVLHVINKTFFLRMLDNLQQCKKKNGLASDVLLWMWILTDSDVFNDFQFQVEVLNAKEEVLLSVSSPVYSLWKKSWKSIVDNKRGVFLNLDMLEQFGAITLSVQVQKIDGDKV